MISKEKNSNATSVSVDYLKKKSVLPEETNKLHYHPYHEFLIINKGFVTYTSDNGVVKIAEKSIVYMPVYTLHNPFVQKSNPYERYRIKFSPDFSDRAISQPSLLGKALKNPYIKQLNKSDFDEIYSLTESLYKIASKENKNELDMLNECLHLAMLAIKGESATPIQVTPEPSYISGVLKYIKENYNEHLTIQMLAERFFVSKSKLIYDFNNHCRISILEYITMTRIEAAKEYLLSGWSVAATAEASGFSTASYFIKVFSKITGFTPLKFQSANMPSYS